MTKINLGRVILGGLLAGVVVNVSEFLLHTKVIQAEEAASLAAKGANPGQIWVWLVYGFVYGIVAVWLYAAIRPRFGAGARTAACAGVIAWFFNTLLPGVAMVNMGFYPSNLNVTSTLWGLVESIVAVIVGAWLYREA